MLKYFKVYNNIISAADSDIILKHLDIVLKRKKYEGSPFKTDLMLTTISYDKYNIC